MRLLCGCLEQCEVQSDCLSMKSGSIKIRPVLPLPPVFCHQLNMSATAKSTSPITPAATKSREWMKASTLELQSSSEDESNIFDAKVKEHC